MTKDIFDQDLHAPINVSAKEMIIGSYQETYSLTQVEYIKLTTGQPKLFAFTWACWSLWGGFILSLAPKTIDTGLSTLTAGEIQIAKWLFMFNAFLTAIQFTLPNPKKETLKKIKAHFNKAEPEIQLQKKK